MLLDYFPPEIGLRILHELLPQECQNILSVISPENDLQNREVATWLYSRIYGNSLVIYFDSNGPPAADFCATTGEMLARFQDEMFLANAPKHLSFKLVRDYQEVSKFQAALRTCEKVIEGAGDYFNLIARISFHLDGRYLSEMCSTLLLVAISCLLLKLTKLKETKLKSLTVTGTTIGDVFPEKWDKVFNCYKSIEALILDDNNLKIPRHVNPKSDGEFTWPSTLKELSLAGNAIQTFSTSNMRNLPHGLESLNISRNDISFFGALDGEVFNLAQELPYIRKVNLSDCRSLARVDPSVFRGARSLPKRFVLDLSGCNLAQQNWDDLEELASVEQFVLLR